MSESVKSSTPKSSKSSKKTEDMENSSETRSSKSRSKGKDKSKKSNSDDSKKLKKAFSAAAKDGCCAIFPGLDNRLIYDKFGNTVYLYILDNLSNLAVLENNDTVYPESKYFTYDDKVNSSSRSKAPVNKTKVQSVLQRGQNKEDVENEEEEEEESLSDEDSSEKEPESKKESRKKTSKKNITSLNRNSKTCLGFIVMRFLDEMYELKNKNVQDKDAFRALVFKEVSRDLNSHISRHIIMTVDKYSSPNDQFKDPANLSTQLNSLINNHMTNSQMSNYITQYTIGYFKLLSQYLSNLLWVSRKSINQKDIEAAMRNLDMGNNALMKEKGLVQDGKYFGLNEGVIHHMNRFDTHLNPPLTEEEKKKRNEKRKSKTPKKEKKSKSKSKKSSDDKSEEDEDEKEEDDEEEDDGEEDDEEDDEEDEVEYEESDKKKKPLKKE
jgi:hypothetical protein